MIEDVIEKIITYLKKSEEEYHLACSYGFVNLIPFWPTLFTILGWTGLYLLNIL